MKTKTKLLITLIIALAIMNFCSSCNKSKNQSIEPIIEQTNTGINTQDTSTYRDITFSFSQYQNQIVSILPGDTLLYDFQNESIGPVKSLIVDSNLKCHLKAKIGKTIITYGKSGNNISNYCYLIYEYKNIKDSIILQPPTGAIQIVTQIQ